MLPQFLLPLLLVLLDEDVALFALGYVPAATPGLEFTLGPNLLHFTL